MTTLYNSRSDWGAAPPKGTLTRWDAGQPTGIAVHYVGGGGSIGLTTKPHSACLTLVKNLQGYAFAGGNGWVYTDLEYDLLACPHGYVIEGRGLAYQGAAQKGANGTHVSVCALANVADPVTSGLAMGLVGAIEMITAHFGRPLPAVGHRDTAGNPTGTDCPGDFIEAWLSADHSPRPSTPVQEDPVYVTYQSQLHGFYIAKDRTLWQRFEGADGTVREVNISAAVHFGPVDPTRPPQVAVTPNGDLLVGIYGADNVFNEARWVVAAGKWTPRTYR